MALLPLKKFCFCCDLRKGCIVYAWLQMMFVTVLIIKIGWVEDYLKHALRVHYSQVFQATLQLGLLTALQLIKGASSPALIWGVVKNKHMFYQPWLFINGLENALLILMTVIFLILACFDPSFFYVLPCVGIFAAYGWYIWACVFVVYKRDMNLNTIASNGNYDNLNMDNVNIQI